VGASVAFVAVAMAKTGLELLRVSAKQAERVLAYVERVRLGREFSKTFRDMDIQQWSRGEMGWGPEERKEFRWSCVVGLPAAAIVWVYFRPAHRLSCVAGLPAAAISFGQDLNQAIGGVVWPASL